MPSVPENKAYQLPDDGDPLFPVPEVAQSDALTHICKLNDDMLEARKHIDAADEIIVVCPLYFASAPAQMKALLDRLQPYYWSNIRNSDTRRNMEIHVIGEDGNPYGFDALITTLESAFGVCGFSLSSIFDWRGRISAQGEILDEPEEYFVSQEVYEVSKSDKACEEKQNTQQESELPSAKKQSQNKANKPKLSLSVPGNTANKNKNKNTEKTQGLNKNKSNKSKGRHSNNSSNSASMSNKKRK
jgi:multimeric flavodoxin WrbA